MNRFSIVFACLAAACTSAAQPNPILQHLDAAPVSDLAGTWASDKAAIELDADGGLTLTEDGSARTGAWGVAGAELAFAFDVDGSGTSEAVEWTYVADAQHLGVGYRAAGSANGPVGTWTGDELDEYYGSGVAPVSGGTVHVALTLAADGTVSYDERDTTVGSGPSETLQSGTYTVASDGSLAVSLFAGGSASDTETLAPIGGGYAGAVFTRQ